MLTPEIVEYVTALLTKHEDTHLDLLHKRLYDFYWRWSDGEFIDAPPENLPQQKMRLLREQMPDRDKRLGQRQVDIHTGLNAMILLLELHRYGLSWAQKPTEKSVKTLKSLYPFHPCARLNPREFDRDRLLKLVGISHCISCSAFKDLVGNFLYSSDLRRTALQHIDLSVANLSNADLSDAHLYGAFLLETNLCKANLEGANLIRAEFHAANLTNANLSNTYLYDSDCSSADFRGANLQKTNLSGANFDASDFSGADFSGAEFSTLKSTVKWDNRTQWKGVIGLDKSIGVPDELKRQLGLDRP